MKVFTAISSVILFISGLVYVKAVKTIYEIDKESKSSLLNKGDDKDEHSVV